MVKYRTKINAPLSDREKEIWAFLLGYFADHAYAPTIQEIAEYFTITRQTAWELVQNMKRKGWLVIKDNVSRGIVDPVLYDWVKPKDNSKNIQKAINEAF